MYSWWGFQPTFWLKYLMYMYMQESVGKFLNKKFWYTYTKTILWRHCIGHFIMSLYILLNKFRTCQKSWIDMYSEWTHLNVSWEISSHIVSFARILPIFEVCFPVILLWSGTWEDNHYKRSLDQFSTVLMLLEILVVSSTVCTLLVWTNYCF